MKRIHLMNEAAPWRRWLLGFGIWTCLGVAFGSQFYFVTVTFGHPVPWLDAVFNGLREWYLWGLLALLIWRVADRFPFERGSFLRSFCVHMIACVATIAAYELLNFASNHLFGNLADFRPAPRSASPPPGRPPPGGLLFPILSFKAAFDGIIFWALVFVRHALNYYQRLQERYRIEAELKSSLTEAQLRALKMQLQPHFLFNTLNAIATLVHKDPKTAEWMIGALSELLRSTLEFADRDQVALREELEFIDRYLAIQQLRFGDRLNIERNVDPAVLEAKVPPMILQPIVENAIEHGIEPKLRNGRLDIIATREQNELKLIVQDNGPGFEPEHQFGIGLQNTRARLNQLYGHGKLTCENRLEGGARVMLILPFRPAPAAAMDAEQTVQIAAQSAVESPAK